MPGGHTDCTKHTKKHTEWSNFTENVKGWLFMATIIPNARGGKIVSYKFRAFLGRDETGKQITRYSTWPVPEDMSPTKGRRAAKKAAELWEKQAQF